MHAPQTPRWSTGGIKPPDSSQDKAVSMPWTHKWVATVNLQDPYFVQGLKCESAQCSPLYILSDTQTYTKTPGVALHCIPVLCCHPTSFHPSYSQHLGPTWPSTLFSASTTSAHIRHIANKRSPHAHISSRKTQHERSRQYLAPQIY